MVISWIEQAKQFKSPLSVVAGFLLRSRETQARRARERAEEVRQLKEAAEQQQKVVAELHERLASKDNEIADLKNEVDQLRRQPVTLPQDPRLPNHGYGPNMISLAINCARLVGLRAAERVLELIRDWLGADFRVPSWTTIRTWLMRMGLSQIADPATFQRADDWIWLVDHSNQIGQEKVLVVLAIRASQLPPPGQALRHEDVTVLCIQPGTQWKREDVAKVYLDLEVAFGTPRGVLSDGAVELQEAAEQLQNTGEIDSDVFRDLKHVAANILKLELGKDERFQDFTAQLGKTRASIQQTELGHLTPPQKKTKARFMNLASNLRWAEMALWGLQHPEAQLRAGITNERMEDKLGWLREFESELTEWNECQRVVSTAVKFAAEQGVSIGATESLRREIGEVLNFESVQRVRTKLLAFMQESESKLQPGERLPISTEILESSFGLYKCLERQHSRGGFTGLIASFPALLRPITPKLVQNTLPNISNQTVRDWVKEKLGKTLAAKRTTAYAEYKKATKRATIHLQMT